MSCPPLAPGGQLGNAECSKDGPLPGKGEVIAFLGNRDHVNGREVENAQCNGGKQCLHGAGLAQD